MIRLHVAKGHDLRLAGSPSAALQDLGKPATVALLPERLPFIKPRLTVATGDAVRIGSVLLEDKRRPALRFLSPGGGRVAEIRFGPRRAIREIVVELAAEEEHETFAALDEAALAGAAPGDLAGRLMQGGLWPLIRQLPYRSIPDPDAPKPALTLVGLAAREPFRPAPEVYLEGREDLLRYGLKTLERFGGRLCVFAEAERRLPAGAAQAVTHRVSGAYPADDAGAVLYRLRRETRENRSWYIDGQDLLLIASFLRDGRFPTERTVVVAGSGVRDPGHCRIRWGAPLSQLTAGRLQVPNPRLVVGGLFRGFQGTRDGHMGYFETALNVIPEPGEREFLKFVRPGADLPSYSRTFLSRLRPGPRAVDANVNGGRRACIACGYCAEVCPVDILPQMTLKSILAEEVEEVLAHGLLDCVECGLCTYVCPSKIELAETFQRTKHLYWREQASP
jgi:Na+-transporting NADH:ubiquinone oxidoreductase subunit A